MHHRKHSGPLLNQTDQLIYTHNHLTIGLVCFLPPGRRITRTQDLCLIPPGAILIRSPTIIIHAL
jgi:hypothetical protein